MWAAEERRSSVPSALRVPALPQPQRWASSKWVTMRNTLFLVLALLLPRDAESQTAPEIAKRAFASTVLLAMEDARGQPTSLGSGFFISTVEVATNLHVITGSSSGYVKLVGQPAKLNIDGVVAIDRQRDLVILKVGGAAGRPLALGNSDAVQVGEPVFAVGNPQGLEGTFSQGIISGLRTVGQDRLLQLTAPISPGSSGGPVLNSRGEVIGVSVATYREGQNLNFAIPSKVLRVLMEGTRQLVPLSQIKRKTRTEPSASSIGQRSTDGVLCEQLTWEYVHGQSGEYAISIRNRLRDSVRNVHCLLIFYDSAGNPIDVDAVRFSGVVPAGLARRTRGSVDGSVQRLTTPSGALRPKTRVESRTLNFDLLTSER